MSHFASFAASALLMSIACSSPKAPAAPEAPAEASAASQATDANGAGAEERPAADAPAGSAGSGGSASAGSEAASVQTLFVREQLADCQGEGARKCLMVRGAESEDWRNFFGVIDGFDYEPSYAYELRVEVTPIANPPQDAPSLRYRLVEVVSKRKTE